MWCAACSVIAKLMPKDKNTAAGAQSRYFYSDLIVLCNSICQSLVNINVSRFISQAMMLKGSAKRTKTTRAQTAIMNANEQLI